MGDILLKKFKDIFGAEAEEIYSAAGRVNLIGEHIDYCGGLVLPAALSLKCRVAVRKNGSDLLRIAATDLGERIDLNLRQLDRYRDFKWGNYQAGVADEMIKAGYNVLGLDILYDCSVPFGSGLSSSAAIEVATAYAIAKNGGNKIDKIDLAIVCKRAENDYCGVNCGIMDQFASANGKKHHAVLLDCASLEHSFVPLDLGDYALIIANCNKPHSLRESKYNERRRETEEALRVLKQFYNVENLCDITLEQLEEKRDILTSTVYRRACHAVSENERVKMSVDALKKGDIARFGRLLNESHRSLRDDFEVTGKELDALVSAAWDHPDCIGSRMTGGGFGGCTVSLVKKTSIDDFTRKVGGRYKDLIGYKAAFYTPEIADGIIDEGVARNV